MVEFCKKCDGMMLPSKDRKKKNLVCNSCGHTEPIEKNNVETYIFNTEIYHQPGEEFKNLEKMKDWKKASLD
jgi:DNA-directed RNA polymerase subunit M/transcription elongation factor TFIIS